MRNKSLFIFQILIIEQIFTRNAVCFYINQWCTLFAVVSYCAISKADSEKFLTRK